LFIGEEFSYYKVFVGNTEQHHYEPPSRVAILFERQRRLTGVTAGSAEWGGGGKSRDSIKANDNRSGNISIDIR